MLIVMTVNNVIPPNLVPVSDTAEILPQHVHFGNSYEYPV